MLDGRLLATRARVALLSDDELTAAAADSPRANLAEIDRTEHVQTLIGLAEGWATSRPEAIVDLTTLLSGWAPTGTGISAAPASTGAGSGTGGRAGSPAPLTTVPAQARPTTGATAAGGGARGGRPDARLRQLVITHVLTHAGVTRAQVRDHVTGLGFSNSGAYKEIAQLIQDGGIREDDQGRLTATLWDHAPLAVGEAR